MSTSQLGQVRSLSDSEELPPSKRPRTDATEPQISASTSTNGAQVIAISEADILKQKAAERRDRKRENRRKKQLAKLPDPCSAEDVLWKDIQVVLGQDAVNSATEVGSEFDSPFKHQEEVELEVKILGSNGDGIAVSTGSSKPWAVVVPLALPNERVRARIYRHARLHSFGDLLEVITPNNELRDSSLIRCKYFGTCGGCQYQMLSYETQLDFKRNVVVKAFKNYSNLSDEEMPPILSTVPSPLKYEYRTKLTPHFEAPPKDIRKNMKPISEKPDWLKIGFNRVGTQKVMDIEECPIATPVVNAQMAATREEVVTKVHTYKKGVSLLFRESLDTSVNIDDDSVDRLSDAFNKQICVTDPKSLVRERVGDWIFEYNAGSFFQNNNSVLLPLTDYVRNAIFPPDAPTPSTLTHLVDTYCGAGLFGIVLSPSFQKVAGIELSQDSIRFATRNAELNKISKDKISFRAGNAGEIFAVVQDFPADQTAVLIDPPRKGCDEFFIKQLLEFGPKTIVYVSCNVHTQARDVGQIMEAGRTGKAKKYTLDSVRGFDLFPQTAHVESVAVLTRVS
ncbi:tRNA methyltransferase [Coprinopsis cinerea okayama7|uniref:tRNA methyltransferase n=1 Tax=Coprinopsis cinerea (strain Okayama-7 / 130 / ATCC MYA-4618 / FGSC 9003) TaxID=240176 RepID=A8N040_COPC7|nr:tRNA methyltransferase [Coprinopsis cinerea okayama7\|eukprot:XP_001828228.1 tRNA methyltransferase [Coprinopsis cinerea okayama7\